MPLYSSLLQGIGLTLAGVGTFAAAGQLGVVFRALPTESPATFERLGSPARFDDAALKMLALHYALLGRDVISPPSATAERYRSWLRLTTLAVIVGWLLWLLGIVISYAESPDGGAA